MREEKQTNELSYILARKGLAPNLFSIGGIRLEDNIAEHVRWAFENIYSKPYPSVYCPESLARLIHGIQHATRVLINVVVFINLFRRYGDVEALGLNDYQLKLLQLAALFHDSAREDENEDHWDQESGVLLYYYLTYVLAVDQGIAKKLAEAIANKDAEDDDYYELIIKENSFFWKKSEEKKPKNIYQELIHDADCLDILRVVHHFQASYLDFYAHIVKYGLEDFNKAAFREMAILIIEARSITETQGDSRIKINPCVKSHYEHARAYESILTNILANEHCQLFPFLYANGRLLSGTDLQRKILKDYDTPREHKTLTTECLTEAMHEGRLLARGISVPSFTAAEADFFEIKLEGSRISESMLNFLAILHSLKRLNMTFSDENMLEIELRKMMEEDGNDWRSTTLLCYGCPPFTSPGLLILNPKMENVRSVSKTDQVTGFGEKKEFASSCHVNTVEETKKQWQELMDSQMCGGSVTSFSDYVDYHNEIIYHLKPEDKNDIVAFYYTNDPISFNHVLYSDHYPLNTHTHYLQALFMQKVYLKIMGVKRPICEYSAIHHYIKVCPDYRDEQIVGMWKSMISNVIQKKLEEYESKGKKKRGKRISKKPLEILKIEAIYGSKFSKSRKIKPCSFSAFPEECSFEETEKIFHEVVLSIKSKASKNLLISLDSNYTHELREKINTAIVNEKERLLEKYQRPKRRRKFKEILFFLSENSEILREKSQFFFNETRDIDDFYRDVYDRCPPFEDLQTILLAGIDNEEMRPRVDYFFNKNFFHFSSENIIKIYFLAWITKDDRWIESAKEQAKEIIVNLLGEVDEFLSFSKMFDSPNEKFFFGRRNNSYSDILQKIFEYAILFELIGEYSEKISEQLNQYLNNFLTRTAIRRSEIKKFKAILNVFKLFGFLDEGIAQRCRIILTKFKKECSVYKISHEEICERFHFDRSMDEYFSFPELYHFNDEHSRHFYASGPFSFSMNDDQNFFSDLSSRFCGYRDYDENSEDQFVAFQEMEDLLNDPLPETWDSSFCMLKQDLSPAAVPTDSNHAIEASNSEDSDDLADLVTPTFSRPPSSPQRLQQALFPNPEFKRINADGGSAVLHLPPREKEFPSIN